MSLHRLTSLFLMTLSASFLHITLAQATCSDLNLRLAVTSQNYAEFKRLFSKDCNANSSAHGNPIFTVAALSGTSIYLLEYLRQLGANPKQINTNGKTVFDYFTSEEQQRGFIYTYLEALKAGTQDPINASFEKMGVLFEQEKCNPRGKPYVPKDLFVPSNPVDQKPAFKDRMIIESVFASRTNVPNKHCPKEAHHFFFDLTQVTLSQAGSSYEVKDLRVHCCQ